MKKAIVIGSGFTGCMFAMMLKQRNWDVNVIDKSNFTGGGVRTLYHGGHPFTYGPRHFIGPEENMPAFEFLNKIVPMRHIKKFNYSYQAEDDYFAHYPMHVDDIKKLKDSKKIFNELENLPPETKANNFEEFWLGRVGKTLYERFNKFYNLKAWQLKSNKEMNYGFEATVKRKPLETGPKNEFHTGYINAYPIAHDGYNKFFDVSLNGCNVILDKLITKVDIDKTTVYFDDDKLSADLIISTISPDFLFDNCWGELAYVGRDFFKIVLPTEQVLPDDVYFFIIQTRANNKLE